MPSPFRKREKKKHQKLKRKSLQHQHHLQKEVLSVRWNPPWLDPNHIDKNVRKKNNQKVEKKWIILYINQNKLDLKWHAHSKLCCKRLVQKFWHLE